MYIYANISTRLVSNVKSVDELAFNVIRMGHYLTVTIQSET